MSDIDTSAELTSCNCAGVRALAAERDREGTVR